MLVKAAIATTAPQPACSTVAALIGKPVVVHLTPSARVRGFRAPFRVPTAGPFSGYEELKQTAFAAVQRTPSIRGDRVRASNITEALITRLGIPDQTVRRTKVPESRQAGIVHVTQRLLSRLRGAAVRMLAAPLHAGNLEVADGTWVAGGLDALPVQTAVAEKLGLRGATVGMLTASTVVVVEILQGPQDPAVLQALLMARAEAEALVRQRAAEGVKAPVLATTTRRRLYVEGTDQGQMS